MLNSSVNQKYAFTALGNGISKLLKFPVVPDMLLRTLAFNGKRVLLDKLPPLISLPPVVLIYLLKSRIVTYFCRAIFAKSVYFSVIPIVSDKRKDFAVLNTAYARTMQTNFP